MNVVVLAKLLSGLAAGAGVFSYDRHFGAIDDLVVGTELDTFLQ